MNTVILSHFPEGMPVPTSSIRDIEAVTSKTSVEVSIWTESSPRVDDGVEVFFATSYASYSSGEGSRRVIFSDVGTLIEEYLREIGRSQILVNVEIDGVLLEIDALYCEESLPVDFVPAGKFLTLSRQREIHPDSSLVASIVSDGSKEITINGVGFDADGNVVAGSTVIGLGLDCEVGLSVRDIVDDLGNPGNPFQVADLRYFAVNYASDQILFFVVRHPRYRTFSFRNLFNAAEFIDVVGDTSDESEITRQLAVCGGRSVHYDQKSVRSYVVSTGPVNVDQAKAYRQMFASRDVRLIESPGSKGIPVLITDSECKISSDDASLQSFKFTWRFADNRPRLGAAEADDLKVDDDRVFTDHFTREFK